MRGGADGRDDQLRHDRRRRAAAARRYRRYRVWRDRCQLLLGRAFGLPPKMAVLVACGNAICGNSAIAAVAPVIDAESDDVATAIAFTAVLGVAVVIALPIVAHALHPSAAAGERWPA
jgi:hypothetical protein